MSSCRTLADLYKTPQSHFDYIYLVHTVTEHVVKILTKGQSMNMYL